MKRPVLVPFALTAALVLAGLTAHLSAGKTTTVRLPVAGKGDLDYTCRVTSTVAEAETRAAAAHAAFQTGFTEAAAAIAEQMQAAMTKASATGDLTDLEAARSAYRSRSVALRSALERDFGCSVDTTLQTQD